MEDYIVGFLAADGSTYEEELLNGEKRYNISLEICDKEILEKICKKYNKELYYRTRIINKKQRDFYKITYNREESKDIGKYLVKGRPNIYEYYKRCNKIDFIRGYFDGDGTIALRKNKQNVIGFSINSYSPDLLLILEDFANEYGFTLSKYFDKRGNGSWFITINRINEIEKFYNLIYSNNPELYLKRKYDKFLKCGFPKLVII